MTGARYPDAHRLDLVDDLFGHPVADPYRWLEDPDAAPTRDWLTAQDALTRPLLDALPGRAGLRARLTELMAAGMVGVPAWRGERAFFLRRQAGQEHAVLVVREPDGAERVLLDPTAVDESGTTTLDAWQPDKEGRRLACQLSTGGTEESLLHVLDVDTGTDVEPPIDRTRYSPVAWLPGGEAFFYVRRLPPDVVPAGEEQYHRRVYLHRLGADPAADPVVFGDGLDKTCFFGVTVSRDGRWLVVTATEGTAPRDDVWIAALDAGPLTAPALVEVQRGVDALTALHVGRDGRLYVFTNLDAPRGRLAVTTPEKPGPEHWSDLVPEDPEAVLEDYAILDGPALGERPRLVLARTRHAVSEVTVHDLADGSPLGTVPLPGLGSLTGLGARPEGGHEAWIGYTDYVTPPRVLRYDALRAAGSPDTGAAVEVWAAPPSPYADGSRPRVRAEQVTYRSADGTPVRMFVLSPLDGPAGPRPAILYGYGGFNIALTPGYTASALAWVEAGGTYAVANLRGGAEEGEQWHRAGMREHKQNVFDDFLAAAQWLVDDGRTSPDALAISGGSNGGLLVGAALTQRPDLFAAVTCSAPLLDMVRYERSGLGRLWSDEYGSADDPEELRWLLGYSPYHRVAAGTAFPAVLFTVFDSDTRVDPMHARKMCAALQHATAGERPVLLRREAEVGHGARSVTRTVELTVDVLAFVAAETGLRLADEGTAAGRAVP